MKNAYYWFGRSKNGPSEGALVREDGSLVRLNYRDYSDVYKVRDHHAKAVALLTLIPKSGKWKGEATHPFHGGTVWTSGEYTTPEEAGAAILLELKNLREDEEALRNDPLRHLERELLRHDWWHHQSDSWGVCKAGEAHRKEIEEISAKCNPALAKALWDRYCPY